MTHSKVTLVAPRSLVSREMFETRQGHRGGFSG